MIHNTLGKKAITTWLVIGAMILTASLAIIPNTEQPTVAELSKKAINLGDALVLNPFRIDQTVDITATNAVSVGTTATHADMAVINFMSDVGEDVTVELDIINDSSSELSGIVTIRTTGDVLASVDDTASTFSVVRFIGGNQWFVHFLATGGGADTLALRVTTLSPGLHTVTVNISPFD